MTSLSFLLFYLKFQLRIFSMNWENFIFSWEYHPLWTMKILAFNNKGRKVSLMKDSDNILTNSLLCLHCNTGKQKCMLKTGDCVIRHPGQYTTGMGMVVCISYLYFTPPLSNYILPHLVSFKLLVWYVCFGHFLSILTCIMPKSKVLCLCHQYRARPACTSVQSQALYCWQT